MNETSQNEVVRFSSTGASVAGCVSGVAMSIGVPWVLLTHGQALGSASQTILVWVGVCLGGLIALVSAFFGLVMPSQVGTNPWEHHHGRHRHGGAPAGDEGRPGQP